MEKRVGNFSGLLYFLIEEERKPRFGKKNAKCIKDERREKRKEGEEEKENWIRLKNYYTPLVINKK